MHKNLKGVALAVAIAGSQRKLAAELGISQQAVFRMVANGYAPMAHRWALLQYPGVKVVDLLPPDERALFEHAQQEG